MDQADVPTEAVPTSSTWPEGGVLAERYVLGDLLGRGGMADVFRARDRLLGRDVAVKLFRTETLEESDEVRAEEEARMSSSLSHPGLVTVHDARLGRMAQGERNFIVMELVEGPILSQLLRERGGLTPPEVAGIGAQTAAALAHVHRQGMVHRDVKPGNILLTTGIQQGDEPPQAKLGDFSIARVVDATRITVTGMTLGTAPYMSPEQVRGEDVGPPSDVYSLGLVLLQALTGAVAYPGAPVESALARLSRAPQITEDLGSEWRELLAAMTAMQPTDRPSSAQVAHTLTAMLAPAELGMPGDTQLLPTLDLPDSRAARWAHRDEPVTAYLSVRGWWHGLSALPRIAAVGVCLAVLLALALVLRPSSRASPLDREPAYPSVTGRLGDDLTQLQKAVEP